MTTPATPHPVILRHLQQCEAFKRAIKTFGRTALFVSAMNKVNIDLHARLSCDVARLHCRVRHIRGIG